MRSIIWSTGPRNRSGAILQPCQTPLPTANQSDITPSTLTQLHVSVYRPSMRSTTLLCRPRLNSSFYTAIRSTESNAAFRSTKAIQRGFWNSVLLWMIVFKVKIRSIVDRLGVNPLCCTLRCARSWSRTLFSRTVANTFPVCLSHVSILSKQLHISSKFFHHRVTPSF